MRAYFSESVRHAEVFGNDYENNHAKSIEFASIMLYILQGGRNMTSLSIRMEDETKAGFDKFCDEIGLSVSSVFNMFAKKVVREQRIPFEINANPFYSEENMKFLRESIAQDKSGNLKTISMNELKSMAEAK